MFEHVSEPLLSRRAFLTRLAGHLLLGLGLIAISLLIGMFGYHSIESLEWRDAFLNAAMLVGGMGPLEHKRSPNGMLFEGFYALWCCLAIILVSGIVLAPIGHRVLHKMHKQHHPGS